jgi:hypothetical protein
MVSPVRPEFQGVGLCLNFPITHRKWVFKGSLPPGMLEEGQKIIDKQ